MKNSTLVFLLFLVPFFGTAQNLDSGLVLHYPFNGNAAEARGSGNNGSVQGAQLTTDRFGHKNSAYLFDGKNDYIKIGNRVLTDKQGSISAWLYTNDSVSRNPIFSQGQESANATSLRFTIWSDSLAAVCDHRNCATSKDLPTIKAKYDVAYGTWIHVALVSDGSTYKMYANGIEYAYSKSNKISGQWFEKLCSSTQSAFIGRWKRSANDEYFNGKIDDLRIYDRPLTAKEIAGLSTEGQCFETITDTTYVTVADTLRYHDTTFHQVYDTTFIKVVDSIKVYDTIAVFDTLRTSVTDTLFIDLTTVGLNQNEHNRMKVYPNPSSGKLVIENGDYALMKQWRINLISSAGKRVFSSPIHQQIFEIDLGDFGGKGLYFIQLYNPENELIEVKKILLK